MGQFLAGTAVAVAGPWHDPGPHLVDGVPVSLWHGVDHTAGTVSGRAFGTMLGELHVALASYDADLPPLVGPLTDIATALARFDDEVLHRAAEQLVPLALGRPRRALHGDAHTGNVLLSPDGPRWTDFEDPCVGPVEWDLASLTLDERAVRAYPGPVDRRRLEDCRDLRRLQVLASLLVGGDDVPELRAELEEALRRRL